MEVTVVSVGKIKEPPVLQGIEAYSRQLDKYCRLNLVEVPDAKAPEHLSDKEREQVKNLEGQGILKRLKEDMYVIALDIKGQMLSSAELAGKIRDLRDKGCGHLAFVIGGSLGLSREVLGRADFRLSFGPLTFPHQLMRLMLLEQLCRCFKHIDGQG
ncbi:MAG TPA: 23S rRNA (pseudouridine(1915)-N(3))-methyltransferase RlmH [Clostridia bacterium]|nr:23S rRNA (pseudouridine(1915)-N(3))-methyltransferase RlmH [Clostridia bacterium]